MHSCTPDADLRKPGPSRSFRGGPFFMPQAGPLSGPVRGRNQPAHALLSNPLIVQVRARVSGFHERVRERVLRRLNERVGERPRQWVCERADERPREWVRERSRECPCERVRERVLDNAVSGLMSGFNHTRRPTHTRPDERVPTDPSHPPASGTQTPPRPMNRRDP